MSTVYVSIGNSDDGLTQAEWAQFVVRTALLLRDYAVTVHGQWLSEPASAWQSACWCVEFDTMSAVRLARAGLVSLAYRYRQDYIAWAAVAETELLKGKSSVC